MNTDFNLNNISEFEYEDYEFEHMLEYENNYYNAIMMLTNMLDEIGINDYTVIEGID